MKKSLQYVAALGAFAVANAWAGAADALPLYAKLSAGQTEIDAAGFSLEEGAAYGAAVGAAVGPFRLEAGADRLSGSFAGFAEADAIDWHAMAYVDLSIGENASVFVGGGLDYIDGEVSAFAVDQDASGDGYSLAAGAAYRFSEGVIGEAQWRRVEADLSSDFGDIDASADVVSVGLRLTL